MKLLFDQNISFRILEKLKTVFPESSQVRLLGLENAADLAIWEYARQNDFTIVTFDADFYDIANLRGHPPKIIWLRTGNTTTQNIATLIVHKSAAIKAFLESQESKSQACLQLN